MVRLPVNTSNLTKTTNKSSIPAFISVICCDTLHVGSLGAFLEAISPGSCATFLVLCPHLLDPLTSCAISVRHAAPDLVLRRGEVVLIPHGSRLTLQKGVLVPDPSRASDTAAALLESVAKSMSSSCAAVLLGDYGVDAVAGTRSIKAAGGLVIHEPVDPPQANAASELLASISDIALPAARIPACLERFAESHPPDATDPPRRNEEATLARGRKLAALVKRHTGLDLSAYKPEGVSRRIERRMGITRNSTLAQYLAHVQKHPAEAQQLAKDMLVSVTRFFRDPDVFDRLSETVIPGILKEANARPVRLWVPACATGEEAYTLAILLEEALHERGLPAHGFKIFATDLDRDALAFASRGVYPLSIAAGIPPRLLEQYFLPVGESYQILRSVRERIVFAKHNILKDPPFTRLDLISCRNLLIYLQPAAQHRILSVLHFALRQGGALVLGQSESVGDLLEEFAPVDPKTHIFFKQPNSTTSIPDTLQFGSIQPISTLFEHIPPTPLLREHPPSLLLEAFTNRILSHMDRTCFVLNERHEILYSFGNPGKYTTLAEGRASIRLADLLPGELSIPFTTALGRVEKGKPVRFGPIPLTTNKTKHNVSLLVEALHLMKDGRNYLLVFIEEEPRSASTEKTAFDLHQSMLRIRELEEELEFNKARLESTCEELEASREELQTSNEELQAANEELQSTNEELESVNEELQTVNGEYQCKIQELTKTNEDLDNFISSADIATIFLDPDLRIRRFTPTAARLTGLLAHDLGRSITDLSHPLLAEAANAARLVLAGEPKFEKSLPRDEPGIVILRATPYTLKNGARTGTTVSFITVEL